MQNRAYWNHLGVTIPTYGRSGRKGAPDLTLEKKRELAAEMKAWESACQAMDKDVGTGELQYKPTSTAL